jgi:hypothetical protein
MSTHKESTSLMFLTHFGLGKDMGHIVYVAAKRLQQFSRLLYNLHGATTFISPVNKRDALNRKWNPKIPITTSFLFY